MKHTIFIFLISLFIFLATLSASAETLVGSLPGEAHVDNKGAANYTIPLKVPPGTAGMQPELAIAYNSRSGNGSLGVGFSLKGLSSITRAPADRIHDGLIDGVDFDGYDRFLLDGQRLILISTNKVYGEDGSEYRTEIDSFSKIVLHGELNSAGSWFEVKTKSGLIHEYGKTADSFVEPFNTNAALTWAINRTSDTVGNYMDFTYDKVVTNGEHRIERIEYTGNTNESLTLYNKVEFVYEERPDPRFKYVHGAKYNTVKRLQKIEFEVEGVLAHDYRFAYSTNEINRSYLASIQQVFGGGDVVPKTVFNWHQFEGTNCFVSDNRYAPPHPISSESGKRWTYFADMSCDGLPDQIVMTDFDKYHHLDTDPKAWDGVYLNSSTGWCGSFDLFRTVSYYSAQQHKGRFQDLNGDGCPDYFYQLTDPPGAVCGAHLNNAGQGWIAPPAPPGFPLPIGEGAVYTNYIPPVSLDYGGGSEDINGDGLTDMIYHHPLLDPPNFSAYTNNGSGWTEATNSAPPFPICIGTRFIDLNGDGLTDALYREMHSTNLNYAYLNSGNGWVNAPEYEAPIGMGVDYGPVALVSDNIGVEIIDVNGDGLPDFLYHTKWNGTVESGALLNTGSGWISDTNYIPPVLLRNSSNPTEKRLGSFVDVNGDQLPDLLYLSTNTAASLEGRAAYLNTGTGWRRDDRYAPNYPITYSSYLTGSLFVDINADGLVDQVYYDDLFVYDEGEYYQGAYINQGVKAGQLKQVLTGYRGTNEYSTSIEFFYKPLTDPDIYVKGVGAEYPVQDYVGTMHVVSEMAKDNGWGDRYYTMYTYAHARTHRDRGFLGFQIFESYDPQTQLSQVETLAQDFPLTGLQLKTETVYIPDPENYPDQGELLKCVTNTWLYDKVDVGNTNLDYPLFYYVAESNEKQWELGNTNDIISEVTTYNWFDNQNTTPDTPILVQYTNAFPSEISYGELQKVVVDYGDGHKQITSNSYYTVDEGDWLLGRLQKSEVRHQKSGELDVVKTAQFDYIANTGLIATETVEDGTESELQTDYTYDGFGNITNKVVSGYLVAPRSVQRSVYESKGRFVEESFNALNHSEQFLEINPVTGKPQKHIGPNSLPTEWEYDALGRVTLETRADDSWTSTTYAWESGPAFTMPSSSVTNMIDYSITTQSSGTSPVKVCYDRKGREVRTVTESADGRTVNKDTGYDAVGRVIVASNPYFEGNTPNYAFNEYDAISRPKLLTAFDGTKTAYGYGGLVRTVTNNFEATDGPVASRNQHTTTWRNAKGQTTKVKDTLGNELLYRYDATGNLTETEDPEGNITEMEYDIRGNKIRQDDPDMGEWHYTYNALDQLVSQTDANGNNITTSYDVLGRAVIRTNFLMTSTGLVVEAVAKWDYDGDAEGDARGHLRLEEHFDGSGNLVNRKRYAYDEFNRPMLELMNYDDKWYYTCATYDHLSRPVSLHRYWRPKGKEGIEHNLDPQWNTFVTTNIYNARGALLEVRDLTGHTWWQADASDYDEHGRVTQYQYGNGLVTTNTFDPLTARLESIQITDNGSLITDYQFGYDRLGNLTSRSHEHPSMTTLSESCTYDSLNRLVSTINTATNTTTLYNSLGNITARSDVGTYLYGSRPHAVSSVSSASSVVNYSYDNNGNILSRTRDSVQEFSVEWTSFNKPSKIVSEANESEFAYSVDGRRTKQLIIDGSNVVKKVYATPSYEMFETLTNPAETNRANWVWEMEHCRIYVDTPAGKIGIYQEAPGSTPQAPCAVTRSYIHKDHLGSIIATSDESGTNVTFMSFDAWGNRRDPDDWYPITDNSELLTDNCTDRGYTGHEMLYNIGLVHMNGRIYDPVIGRMISADPTIPRPYDLQSFNRYSYVNNGPLRYTDPSGFSLFEALQGTRYGGGHGRLNPSPINSYVLSRLDDFLAEKSGQKIGTDPDGTRLVTDSHKHGSRNGSGLIGANGRRGPWIDQADHGVEASDASVPQATAVENANNHTKSTSELLRADASIVDKHVYGNGKVTLPSHLTQVTEKQMQKMGLDPNSFQRDNGMAAGLYYNSRIEKYMLAYRGTEGLTAIKDWFANFSQSMGFKTGQYTDAMKLAGRVKDVTQGNLIITGYSLGGGLASAASRATGIDAITFNAAGLNSRTVSREYGAGYSSSIQSYVTRGEILNTVQDWTPLPDSVGSRTWQDADHWYSLPIARHGQF